MRCPGRSKSCTCALLPGRRYARLSGVHYEIVIRVSSFCMLSWYLSNTIQFYFYFYFYFCSNASMRVINAWIVLKWWNLDLKWSSVSLYPILVYEYFRLAFAFKPLVQLNKLRIYKGLFPPVELVYISEVL